MLKNFESRKGTKAMNFLGFFLLVTCRQNWVFSFSNRETLLEKMLLELNGTRLKSRCV